MFWILSALVQTCTNVAHHCIKLQPNLPFILTSFDPFLSLFSRNKNMFWLLSAGVPTCTNLAPLCIKLQPTFSLILTSFDPFYYYLRISLCTNAQLHKCVPYILTYFIHFDYLNPLFHVQYFGLLSHKCHAGLIWLQNHINTHNKNYNWSPFRLTWLKE